MATRLIARIETETGAGPFYRMHEDTYSSFPEDRRFATSLKCAHEWLKCVMSEDGTHCPSRLVLSVYRVDRRFVRFNPRGHTNFVSRWNSITTKECLFDPTKAELVFRHSVIEAVERVTRKTLEELQEAA